MFVHLLRKMSFLVSLDNLQCFRPQVHHLYLVPVNTCTKIWINWSKSEKVAKNLSPVLAPSALVQNRHRPRLAIFQMVGFRKIVKLLKNMAEVRPIWVHRAISWGNGLMLLVFKGAVFQGHHRWVCLYPFKMKIVFHWTPPWTLMWLIILKDLMVNSSIQVLVKLNKPIKIWLFRQHKNKKIDKW